MAASDQEELLVEPHLNPTFHHETHTIFASLYAQLDIGWTPPTPFDHVPDLLFLLKGGQKLEAHSIIMAFFCHKLSDAPLTRKRNVVVQHVVLDVHVTVEAFTVFRKAVYLQELATRTYSIWLQVRRIAEDLQCPMILAQCDKLKTTARASLHFKEKMEIQSGFENGRTGKATLHILRMVESGEDSNVTIVSVDQVEVKTHRGILKASSPVFASMFEAHMTESKTGRVEMEDIHGSSLKALLRFIYTGDCSQMEDLGLEEVKELIYSGEKYGLPDLKKYCGYLLVDKCSVENALELKEFANQFGLDGAAVEISSNFTGVNQVIE